MRVTVTGGTSFIGTHVVSRLVADGHEVVVLARNPDRVPALRLLPGVSLVAGTITDEGPVAAALDGADAFVHIALGLADGATGMARADTLPAIRLFEAAADAGVAKIVYTSSVAVFDTVPARFGDDRPQKPARYYGATKAANEAYLMALGAERQVQVNAIRPGYTFGNPVIEGAPVQSMRELPEIARRAASGDTITVSRNAGLQFIWAGDLAAVYAAVLTGDTTRRAFTALSPAFVTWERIARWAVALSGRGDVAVTDDGHPYAEITYDVSEIERTFGLSFDPAERLREHLAYLIQAGL